jgi:hypothetical protein
VEGSNSSKTGSRRVSRRRRRKMRRKKRKKRKKRKRMSCGQNRQCKHFGSSCQSNGFGRERERERERERDEKQMRNKLPATEEEGVTNESRNST